MCVLTSIIGTSIEHFFELSRFRCPLIVADCRPFERGGNVVGDAVLFICVPVFSGACFLLQGFALFQFISVCFSSSSSCAVCRAKVNENGQFFLSLSVTVCLFRFGLHWEWEWKKSPLHRLCVCVCVSIVSGGGSDGEQSSSQTQAAFLPCSAFSFPSQCLL